MPETDRQNAMIILVAHQLRNIALLHSLCPWCYILLAHFDRYSFTSVIGSTSLTAAQS